MLSVKIEAWCSIHSEGVLDAYSIIKGTVRKEDYCELLSTNVRNERHNLTANSYIWKPTGLMFLVSVELISKSNLQ